MEWNGIISAAGSVIQTHTHTHTRSCGECDGVCRLLGAADVVGLMTGVCTGLSCTRDLAPHTTECVFAAHTHALLGLSTNSSSQPCMCVCVLHPSKSNESCAAQDHGGVMVESIFGRNGQRMRSKGVSITPVRTYVPVRHCTASCMHGDIHTFILAVPVPVHVLYSYRAWRRRNGYKKSKRALTFAVRLCCSRRLVNVCSCQL